MSKKQFVYDHENATFVEVEPQRSSLLTKIALVVALSMVFAALLYWRLDSNLLTPEARVLYNENLALQTQLLDTRFQLSALSNELSKLNENDRELYQMQFLEEVDS